MENFEQSLVSWLERAQKVATWKLAIDPKGKKYVRITENNGAQTSAYCFIEKSTGNVLKAASWAKPAIHARGNIYEIGKEGVSEFGAFYLR